MWVELCAEDATPGMCGYLLKSMYGNRDAASNWEDFSRDVCAGKVGFTAGMGSSCLMYHRGRHVRLFNHGDDFVLAGQRADVEFLKKELMKHIALKDKGRLGWNRHYGDLREAKILNRIVRLEGEVQNASVEVEPDPRHVEVILRNLSLQMGSKGRLTPGESDKGELDLTPLVRGDGFLYKSTVTKANHLAEDQYDVRFAVKELPRCRRRR